MSVSKKRRIERTGDPNILICWFDEISEENSQVAEDDSDGEEDHVTESNHDSASEQELTDDEEDVNGDCRVTSYFLGKDGETKWKKEKPNNKVRTPAHNIIMHLPGAKGQALQVNSEIELLNLFLDHNIIRIITNCTNVYIEGVRDNFRRERDARLTDAIEIRAFLGLLYLIGNLRCSRKNASQLWDNSKGNGLESCYLTMSENRFRFLIRCLRFDDMRDRTARKEIDKFAHIRDVFETIVHNFQKYYSVSEYLTIDEQLLAFRGKCPFRQYIPNKPAKYGIKTFALVDAKTGYTLNLETYVGTQPEGPYKLSNSAQDVVMRLTEPVKGTNRNITGDNWFSSMPLVENLRKNKLTYVGTLRKNKREVPKEFIVNTRRSAKSSLFGFQNDKTLVSYYPKNKVVLLVSSMHHDDSIDSETGDDNKPEIITFYNTTKVGVDLVDQLCQNDDVSRNTRRWPMVVFYNLLNIAAINAFCIYKGKQRNEKGITRTQFLSSIAWELMKPQIERRSKIPQIPSSIRRRAHELLGTEEAPTQTVEQRNGSRGRCYECGRSRNKTTRRWCSKCSKWTCVDHLKDVCVNCL